MIQEVYERVDLGEELTRLIRRKGALADLRSDLEERVCTRLQSADILPPPSLVHLSIARVMGFGYAQRPFTLYPRAAHGHRRHPLV